MSGNENGTDGGFNERINSPDDVDHPNKDRMDRHWIPTINNEAVKFVPKAEVRSAKMDAKILLDLALIDAGEPDAETSLEVYSAAWTVDRRLDNSTDGVLERIRNTQYYHDTIIQPRQPGGWTQGLKRALGRGKEPYTSPEQQVPQR